MQRGAQGLAAERKLSSGAWRSLLPSLEGLRHETGERHQPIQTLGQSQGELGGVVS